jgi:tRNA pseudouridine13 synthase
MRFKVQPQDFHVEELAQLPLSPQGDYAIYRVEKRNAATLRVQTHIAAQLGRRQGDVQAPALKDKKAVAIQYLSVRGTGPGELVGPSYRAEFVGRSHHPLRPSDLLGNRFTITLRDNTPAEIDAIRSSLEAVAKYGLPNYFDRQRFGSFISDPQAPDPFMGKTILRRDAEGAVRSYLSYTFVGDPSRIRRFKRQAREHWGEWAYLMDVAPRPSNYRSLLTYLKDHPEGQFRKTLNLIPRRLLSLFLVAYQSYVWNRITAGYLARRLDAAALLPPLTILDQALPVYENLTDAEHAALSGLAIPLPGHRAQYRDLLLDEIVQEVLAQEGLRLNDMKARILKRAYLPKGNRPLLLNPGNLTIDPAQDDTLFPGRQALRLSFTLPSGSYATLVVKRLGLGQDGPA